MSEEEDGTKVRLELTAADVPMSPFVCSPCGYHPDGSKPIPEQEEDWYQHNRDVEHSGITINARCEQCGKKGEHKNLKGKVPQPTPERKNPRHITVFCDETCKKAFLDNLGGSI